MRPFQDYQKNRRLTHLMTMHPHLHVLVAFLARIGETLGPYIGSFWVKAEFIAHTEIDKAMAVFSHAALKWAPFIRPTRPQSLAR